MAEALNTCLLISIVVEHPIPYYACHSKNQTGRSWCNSHALLQACSFLFKCTFPNSTPADYSHLKVVFADIVWIEGLKDYIKIHLKDNAKPIVARLSMKGLEDLLPSSMFIRIQKSYIVSKEHITAIRKNSVFIGATELPIGDNYKEAVYALLGKQPE